MKNLTTEDCKKFIINYYKKNNINTSINEWKRTKKYKVDGIVHRDFKHTTVGEITLKEDNGNLFFIHKESIESNIDSMASSYQGLADSIGSKLINGSIEKTIKEYLDDDYEYLGQEKNEDDGYGVKVTGYYYHSNGRDISLFLYPDKSWIITSD